MQSIQLLRQHLTRSETNVLAHVEDMREFCMVAPTPHGGGHTLWVLGHLAYIESLIVRRFLLGGANPLAEWEPIFDGADVSDDPTIFPAFDDVLAKCRETRRETIALLDSFTEEDLDSPSGEVPEGFAESFGSYRLCLLYAADHWYMHRGQLADARRAAGLHRMWL